MTFVNTLVTEMARVPEHDARRNAGRRLKAALDGLYPRSRGGLRQLADDAKIGPETLYRWFRGDSEPDLGTLRRVAQACGVSRTALVAAMDGEDQRAESEAPTWAQALMTREEVLEMVEGVEGRVTLEIETNRATLIDALAGDFVDAAMQKLAESPDGARLLGIEDPSPEEEEPMQEPTGSAARSE